VENGFGKHQNATALLFSRQNIKDVPAKAGSTRYQDALQAKKGPTSQIDCVGTPDVVLVASGSEVSHAHRRG